MARILDNGKYGFINDQGAVVIAPQYDHATNFSNGLAQIRKDGKWSWINSKGKSVIDNSDLKVNQVPAKAAPQAQPIENEALKTIDRAQRQIDRIQRATQPYYYYNNYYSPVRSYYYTPTAAPIYHYPIVRPRYHHHHHGHHYHGYRNCGGIYYKNWGIGYRGIGYYGRPFFTIKF